MVLEKEELALSDFTRLHASRQTMTPDALNIPTTAHGATDACMLCASLQQDVCWQNRRQQKHEETVFSKGLLDLPCSCLSAESVKLYLSVNPHTQTRAHLLTRSASSLA